MDPATSFNQLKRHKVYRVVVAYAIVARLLIQAASILFPTFGIQASGLSTALVRNWSSLFLSRMSDVGE